MTFSLQLHSTRILKIIFLAASNEVERQSWVTALELAKAKAIRAIESEEEEEDNTAHAIPSEELNTVVRDLTIKYVKTFHQLYKY
jgi:hypothetical protein